RSWLVSISPTNIATAPIDSTSRGPNRSSSRPVTRPHGVDRGRVTAMFDVRHRFPGIIEGDQQGWARFDGPAGTQVVDAAIEATSAWQRSGNNANSHGSFAAADACDALV